MGKSEMLIASEIGMQYWLCVSTEYPQDWHFSAWFGHKNQSLKCFPIYSQPLLPLFTLKLLIRMICNIHQEKIDKKIIQNIWAITDYFLNKKVF